MHVGDPQKIKLHGWRQGDVLSRELVGELIQSGEVSGVDSGVDLCIVISHDCDVTNLSYAAEPVVELIVAKPATKPDGNLTHGKNPRRLQFPVHGEDAESEFEASIHDRQGVDRRRLESFSPDHSRRLDEVTVACIRRWLSSRYQRGAFPDAFNDRLSSCRARIAKSLKQGAKHVSGIYVQLSSWEELEEEDDYGVILIATAMTDVFKDDDLHAQMYAVIDELSAALESCPGVTVQKADLVSESDFSLEDLRYYESWDYDYLSFRDKAAGDIAPRP